MPPKTFRPRTAHLTLFHHRDYEEQPELDQYSETGLDDASDVDEMSADARRAAEREMDARDHRAGDGLFYDEEDEREVR